LVQRPGIRSWLIGKRPCCASGLRAAVLRIFLLEYFELIHLGLGAEEMTPFAVVAKPREMPGRRRSVLAGLAFALALSASSAAMAECTGTGALGVGGVSPFLPFSAGGAVSSLVSAINTTNTAFLTQGTAFVSAPPNPVPNQEGGGVWARAVGGDITTKNTSTTSNVTAFGQAVPGTVTCNNQTRLTFAGVQAGTDLADLNVSGWNFHVGTTVGYLSARANDISSAGPQNPLGGTFQNKLEVPFAGLYAAATKGGFFVDGQIRADLYQNALNDPITSGIFNQKLDARGISVTGNVGYNHSFENNWFIEPSAGIVVSRVKVDPLNITGTAILPGTGGITLPGQLLIDDIKSTLGRLSVRGGTSIVSGNIIWQPFAIASVYHEFEGSVTSSFNTDAVAALVNIAGTPRGSVSSTSIGTYGQFGLGAAAQVANTGWLGYIRGDYRSGDNIQGYSVNGGIRYQFAPDLAVTTPRYAKAPALKAPVMPAAYNWTGFHVGGSFGVMNGQTDYDFVEFGLTANPRFAGPLGGVQAGYDWQTGKWVLGVEGSINGAHVHGAKFCPPSIFFTCESSVNWIGTATGRVGYALWDRTLVYARGGAAFGDGKISRECGQGPFAPPGVGCGQSDSRNRAGWTIGYGTEFALAHNWTVRAESNYFDFGTSRFTIPGPPIAVDVHEKGFISTVGINYRFAPGDVAARY
jgi:outer membrane autotransporter protein